jgi:hypothetical protein
MNTLYKIFSNGQLILETTAWKAVFKKVNTLFTTDPNTAFFVLAFEVSPSEQNIMAVLPDPNSVSYDDTIVPTSRQDKEKGLVQEVLSFHRETQSFYGHTYTYWCPRTPNLKWVNPQPKFLF